MTSSESKCPVDHKLLAKQKEAQAEARHENGHAETQPQEQGQKGQCPVDHSNFKEKATKSESDGAAGKCPVDHSKMQQGKPEQGKCPVDHSAMSAVPGGLKDGKPPKAVCPFGFGSSEADGPSMTSLHCPRCKALFFNCVKSNCGHSFCRDCIIVSKECLSCGDKVVELSPDSKIQDLVDMYVATHSTDPKFLEDREAAGKTKDADATKAEFLLEIALQSFAGGNFNAALTRLQLCKDQLLKMSKEEQPGPDIAVQLGAVCGSQGDCQARLEHPEQASSSYKDSISYLESCPTKTTEIEKASTITQNKLGDLLYRTGNLEAARGLYQNSLQSRRAILASSTGDDKITAELDIAFSLAKAADIEQVLQQSNEAANHLEEARTIASRLGEQNDKLDALAKKRLGLLNAFLSN